MIQHISDRTKLNNGLEMPWLGLGVFQITDDVQIGQAIQHALDIGYRSIDTAAVYKNETGVGEALARSGLPREDIFLTTKVWNDAQRENNVATAFEQSLERLQTDYVDLYLVHWPVADHYQDTWQEMQKVYESGRARAIGVSNFLVNNLQDILRDDQTVPAVNQLEFHPYLVQPDLLNFCKEHGIQVEAWSPLMQGEVITKPTIQDLAEKYGKTPAQVVLRWNLQHDVVTIPKSVTPSRIKENSEIFDFEISAEDMQILDALDEGKRVGPDPATFNF